MSHFILYYIDSSTNPEGKIIKLVCTNIFDFTTMKIDGIRITDESILLRYFTNPFINMYSLKKDSTEIVKSEFIWKNGKPTATEFLEYLDNPVALGNMLSCFKEEFKRIPAFRDDFLLGFIDTVLIKDPYREIINQKRQVIKGEKVGRNDPCPCGSGMKYKRCCGKE